MTFQLVQATETEITVWHTEHGHIFTFLIDPPRDVVHRWSRDVPEAVERADAVRDAAHRFAEGEARARRLID